MRSCRRGSRPGASTDYEPLVRFLCEEDGCLAQLQIAEAVGAGLDFETLRSALASTPLPWFDVPYCSR